MENSYGFPEHWAELTLAELTETKNISYGIVQPGKHDDNGVPIIRVNNFNSNGVDTNEVLKVVPTIAAKHSKTSLQENDILLTLVGSTGQTFVVTKEYIGWNVARAVAVIRPKGNVSSHWIKVCLDSAYTRHFLDSRANTTVQKTLNLSDVKKIPIPIPPENERDFIEKCALSLNNKILNNLLTNQTLEQMAQALFKSWFVDFDPVIDNALAAGTKVSDFPQALQQRALIRSGVRTNIKKTAQQLAASPETKSKSQPDGIPQDICALFPCEFEQSGEPAIGINGWIPKGWQISNIGDACSHIIDHRGKTPKKLGGDWADAGIAAISAKNIKNNSIVRADTIRFVNDELYKKWMKEPLKVKDILMTSEAPMGEMYFLADKQNYLLSQRLYGMRADEQKTTGEYLFQWLQSDIAKSDLEGRATGTTVVGIRQVELKKVAVLLPELALVKKFSELSGQYLLQKERNAVQINSLEKIRNTLLPKLISGEITINKDIA